MQKTLRNCSFFDIRVAKWHEITMQNRDFVSKQIQAYNNEAFVGLLLTRSWKGESDLLGKFI